MNSIISIHTRHDANVSVSIDGKIVLILELERLFRVRYFRSSSDKVEFRRQWEKTIEVVKKITHITAFDYAITSWVIPSELSILKEIIDAKQWLKCDHHFAHASLGYYDAGFVNPIILSFDGGGNDGTFNFYKTKDDVVQLVSRLKMNIGTSYRVLGTLMPELTHHRPQPFGGDLALSGKLMGYSALGEVVEPWIKAFEDYYRYFQSPVQAFYSLSNEIGIDLEEGCDLDNLTARDIAATMQVALENVVISEIEKHISSDTDGVVLVGGCALNVVLNTKIWKHFGLPVHVPSAPNDCGISVGGILGCFPHEKGQSLTYLGLPLEDDDLSYKQYGKKYTLKSIAELLVKDDAIIGVVRGNSEVGPRALGNRSILCFPNKKEKKDIVNFEIKQREWFRPLAPIVPFDKQELFFDDQILSPYMSFALKYKDKMRGKFIPVEHFDGTARLQTVTKKQNEWIYALLEEIEILTGCPIVMNTSFNVKGKPLLNSVEEAFKILNDTEITHLIIEDLLFDKETTKRMFTDP
ncbi:MAG: carbamoyltransferase C-terminal domain-containing protein [bacterium]|nr:carbamoyltransferase C-terminal domain-containing protein [bacterium]